MKRLIAGLLAVVFLLLCACADGLEGAPSKTAEDTLGYWGPMQRIFGQRSQNLDWMRHPSRLRLMTRRTCLSIYAQRVLQTKYWELPLIIR